MDTTPQLESSRASRWLADARRGDAAAVRRAFDALGVPMFRFACLAIGDTTVAEEIVHELFLDLYRRRTRIPRKADTGFLYADLARRCLQHLGRDWVRRSEPSEIDATVKGFLARLAPRTRIAFLLHRAGQPADVIASALGTGRSRAQTLIRDAGIEVLRGSLAGLGRPTGAVHPAVAPLAPAGH